MQSVSSIFTANTQENMRKLNVKVFMSFKKQFDDNITFFTIGSSTIGGTDLIKGAGTVVQEWDKYDYEDVSNRVVGVEYVREQDPVMGGGILSMADITLSNYDDYFTPGSGSSIDGYVLPYRPIKIHIGFEDESVPIFIGITEKMPVIDEEKKTISFHCIDFCKSIFNYPLDEAVLYTDYRTDEIIAELLQLAGLTSLQYSLDTGFNVIPYFYAGKGDKLGGVLRRLAQSEFGNIYMDEQGMIRFVNRQNWESSSEVWTFNRSNIISMETPKQDDIINVVEVSAKVREPVANQKIWESVGNVEVPAGGSAVIWANFGMVVRG